MPAVLDSQSIKETVDTGERFGGIKKSDMLFMRCPQRKWQMNMLAGLMGFGAFVLTLTILGLAGYWKAD